MRLVLRVAGSLTASVLFMLMLASVALAGEPGDSLVGTADATLEVGADVDLVIDTTLDSADGCGSCNDSDTTVDLGTDADLDLDLDADADLVIDLGDGDGCGCNGSDGDTTVDVGTGGVNPDTGGPSPGTKTGSGADEDGPTVGAAPRGASAVQTSVGSGAGSLPDTAIQTPSGPDLRGLVLIGLSAVLLRRRVVTGAVR